MDVTPYIGLPYAPHGRGPEAFDCWGLYRWIVWHEHGKELPSYTESYASEMEKREVSLLIQQESVGWLRVSNPSPGDMVVLNLLGHPWHVGYVVEPSWMIHIMRGTDSVMQSYQQPEWSRRVVEFLRWQ